MKFILYNTDAPPWPEKLAQLKREFNQVEFIEAKQCSPVDIERAHAFVGIPIPEDHFVMASSLQIVFATVTGPVMLPLDVLKKRHIRLSNTHGNAPDVAERALALALGVYGKLIQYHHDLKKGLWHGPLGPHGAHDSWESIRGKACTLVGTGAIGQYLARYLKAFDCRVIGVKHRPVSAVPPNFDEITLDLKEGIEKGELIFVSLPLTPKTQNIISTDLLMRMQNKVLINVGRGAVVDEAGLYQALRDGTLKGAGIDVWYQYPDEGGQQLTAPSAFPIVQLPNIVLSPHVSGITAQSLHRNVTQVIENITSYLNTGDPLYEINFDLMY